MRTYQVYRFHKGVRQESMTTLGKSPVDAVKGLPSAYATHFMVVGPTSVSRFTGDYKKITQEPKFAKVMYEGSTAAICIMFGNIPEFHFFPYVATRDEVFEKCITSTSAESAKAKAAQTDTTVSLEETGASKRRSMSKKISSGSVTSATWRDLLTPENTVKNSGMPKLEDTAMNTWSIGSKTSPSEHSRTLYATVLPLKQEYANTYPGLNAKMFRMAGKSYTFKKDWDYNGTLMYKSKGKYGFIFKGEWLDEHRIFAKVKNIPNGTVATTRSGPTMDFPGERYAGQTLRLKKCFCGCGTYHKGSVYFHPDWLEVNGYDKESKVKEVKTDDKKVIKKAKVILSPDSKYLLNEMKPMCGKVYEFEKLDDNSWTVDGWYFATEWLEFLDEPKTIKAKVTTNAGLGGKMSEMYGNIYRFTKAGECWEANGYLFLKEWLTEVE